jgi:hypothetical protein
VARRSEIVIIDNLVMLQAQRPRCRPGGSSSRRANDDERTSRCCVFLLFNPLLSSPITHHKLIFFLPKGVIYDIILFYLYHETIFESKCIGAISPHLFTYLRNKVKCTHIREKFNWVTTKKYLYFCPDRLNPNHHAKMRFLSSGIRK